jgi:hypothetical protein
MVEVQDNEKPDPRFDRVHNIYVCGLDYDCSCDRCREGFPEAIRLGYEAEVKKDASGSMDEFLRS